MSHFTVLVHLTEEEVNNNLSTALADKLQPYHEYECTGTKDKYVQRFDMTEEKMRDYESEKIEVIINPNGVNLGSKYNNENEHFWKNGFNSSDELELPYGYELRTVRIQDMYDFEKYLTDWCGYSMDGKYSEFVDGRFYNYTNPNAKWDYWQVGGRWSGLFLDKNGKNQDIIVRKDWDIATESANAILKYAKIFDRFEANSDKFEGLVFKSWEQVRVENTNADDKVDYDAARTQYHNQEYKKVLQSVFNTEEDQEMTWLLHDATEFFNVSRETFITNRICNNIGTFAVLDDAGWHEKGEMGWFACVSNENANWNEIYLDKIKNIPDNDVLVLVDCHI